MNKSNQYEIIGISKPGKIEAMAIAFLLVIGLTGIFIKVKPSEKECIGICCQEKFVEEPIEN